MWSQLPILTFTILLAAAAAMLVRTRKERDRMPARPRRLNDAYEHRHCWP